MYSCELQPSKQQFLKEVIHKLPFAAACCIFNDAADTSGFDAPCVVHKKNCTVVDSTSGPALLTGGFSCKDFSQANNNPAAKKTMIQSGSGSSGKTARHALDHLAAHPVPVFLLENVTDFLNETHNQLEVWM
jgi:site-specific DNA-cytosine methylase